MCIHFFGGDNALLTMLSLPSTKTTRSYYLLLLKYISLYPALRKLFNYFPSLSVFFFVFVFVFVFSFFLFRAELAAYGGSQARGLIGAIADSLCHSHSNSRSKPPLDVHHSLQQILDALIKPRDQTCIIMDTSWVPYH